MIAKSVLGLLEAGVTPDEIVRRGIAFGTRYRGTRAGAPASPCSSRWPTCSRHLDAATTAPSRSCTASSSSPATPATTPPRFPIAPLDDGRVASPSRLVASWYRRFVETRSADAAERRARHRDRSTPRPPTTSSA